MSHFLIYIPQSKDFTQVTSTDLARVGLEDHIEGAHTLATASGPDNAPGMVYGWPKPTDNRLDYCPEEQEWFECKADGELKAGRYWVGVWKDSPPTPKDLQRPYPYLGVNVELGDGNCWIVPKIRELTADAIRADDGTWKFAVQKRYHAIYIESLEWQDTVAENREFEYGELADYLQRCLSLNYRIPPDLCAHIRLINTKILMSFLGATLGHELVESS